jgi:EF-P beta-lysylation protein EpmB
VPDDLDWPPLARSPFPLRVPRYFAGLMRRGDARDPLLRQVLASAAEELPQAGFGTDPTGDMQATAEPALLRKYAGRALLLASASCAVHCRYCFRRHFPYRRHAARNSSWSSLLRPLRQDPDVHELILSGGDPLSLSDHRLQALLDAARDIPHLRRLRIHSRTPVVLPSRVTAHLIQMLTEYPRPLALVLHINHPTELSPEFCRRLQRLRGTSVTLLNQAVLLRGVNDDAQILADLNERLYHHGIVPYYLHQLDAVAGAAHFAVDDANALSIQQRLLERLPGYLVPRLVREIPGLLHKVALT